VYEEWQNDVHVIDRFAIPPNWRRIRVLDFGYNNPFVCQWWAIDHDNRMYLYRELYMGGRTVARHKVDICIHSQGERYEATIADHDAEDRATLAETTTVADPALVARLTAAGFQPSAGSIVTLPPITTKAADKRVKVGIEKVQERIRASGDGKPRIFLMVDSLIEEDLALKESYRPTCTHDEFPSYVWMQPSDGRAAKEEPVKVNDHGMDALRYAAMYLDGGPNTQGVSFGSMTKVSKWG